MRKLAREVTIFALLGFLLTSVGLFIKGEIDESNYAQREAVKAVHADVIPMPPPGYTLDKPVWTVKVPLTNGTILQVRECPDSEQQLRRDSAAEEANDCRYFADWFRKLGGRITSVPLGHAEQVAIEKDYWAAYEKSNPQDLTAISITSLLLALLWGIPGAIGVWIFYRLVRFAITG